IAFVVGDVPPEIDCPPRVRSPDGNRDASALGKQMNGEAGEHRLGPQDTERCPCGLLGGSRSDRRERLAHGVCPPKTVQSHAAYTRGFVCGLLDSLLESPMREILSSGMTSHGYLLSKPRGTSPQTTGLLLSKPRAASLQTTGLLLPLCSGTITAEQSGVPGRTASVASTCDGWCRVYAMEMAHAASLEGPHGTWRGAPLWGVHAGQVTMG